MYDQEDCIYDSLVKSVLFHRELIPSGRYIQYIPLRPPPIMVVPSSPLKPLDIDKALLSCCTQVQQHNNDEQYIFNKCSDKSMECITSRLFRKL